MLTRRPAAEAEAHLAQFVRIFDGGTANIDRSMIESVRRTRRLSQIVAIGVGSPHSVKVGQLAVVLPEAAGATPDPRVLLYQSALFEGQMPNANAAFERVRAALAAPDRRDTLRQMRQTMLREHALPQACQCGVRRGCLRDLTTSSSATRTRLCFHTAAAKRGLVAHTPTLVRASLG